MGLIEFGIYAVIVCAIAYVIVYFLGTMSAPPIIPKIVWAVAVLIILLVLARALGISDVPIPKLR